MNQQPLPGPYTKQEVTAFFISLTVVSLIVYILFFRSDTPPKSQVEPSVVNQASQYTTPEIAESAPVAENTSEPDWEPLPEVSYKIISIKPTEFGDFGDVGITAYYTSKNPDKKYIEKCLRYMFVSGLHYKYDSNPDKRKVEVFLYSSKEKAKLAPGAWDGRAMYSDFDNPPGPNFTVSEKFDEPDSRQFQEYQKSVKLFKSKGADFRDAYYTLLRTFKEADRVAENVKFDDIGYSERFVKNKMHKYLSRYGLSDTLVSEISMYGGIYCK